jgi:hypothetical protein
MISESSKSDAMADFEEKNLISNDKIEIFQIKLNKMEEETANE